MRRIRYLISSIQFGIHDKESFLMIYINVKTIIIDTKMLVYIIVITKL